MYPEPKYQENRNLGNRTINSTKGQTSGVLTYQTLELATALSVMLTSSKRITIYISAIFKLIFPFSTIGIYIIFCFFILALFTLFHVGTTATMHSYVLKFKHMRNSSYFDQTSHILSVLCWISKGILKFNHKKEWLNNIIKGGSRSIYFSKQTRNQRHLLLVKRAFNYMPYLSNNYCFQMVTTDAQSNRVMNSYQNNIHPIHHQFTHKIK